jgi:hypothetical protein
VAFIVFLLDNAALAHISGRPLDPEANLDQQPHFIEEEFEVL